MSVGSGRYAEEAVFGVDSVKTAVLAYLHPRDIVAYGPDLIALIAQIFRRNKHCKVCFAASRRESGGDIPNFALRILKA